MGTLVPLELGRRSNPSRHAKLAGSARHINCFAEEVGPEGKTPWAITGDPGLSNFGSALAGGGIREMIAIDETQMLVVAGRNVHRVTPDGVSTIVGGIPTDGPVYARRNRRIPVQVGFVSDGYYAVYDTSGIAEVQDPDLPPPTSLAYLDGYGVLPGPNGRYMLTGIDDFTTIDGLDEGVAEASPDGIVRAHELEREMVLFGSRSIEWHQNVGDADFPFARAQAAEIGCLAAESVAAVDTPGARTLIWVAADHTVRQMQGYGGVVISTNEVEDLIRRLDEAGLAATLKATAWSWGGRFFYALSCASWTRVYDAKTGGWHDKASYLKDRWRVSKVIPFAGKLIAGDAVTGQLYQMSDSAYAEGADPLVMEIIPPTVHQFPYGGVINALHIDAASGVGLNTTTPANRDPVMTVALSRDGGATWGPEMEVALHRLGETARRVQPLYRLGRFGQKGITFRFRISAAVQKLMLGATLDVDPLAA